MRSRKNYADWSYQARTNRVKIVGCPNAENRKGIYSTSVGTGTIDESPMAYKDPKEILQLIADTVEVEYFIKPVINMKATNSYDSSVELDMNEEQD